MIVFATPRSEARERIVEVAAVLLREQGPASVTTRRVAEEAGVQPPTIYRLFGDKDGLLDAVAEHVMGNFAASKAAAMASSTDGGYDPLDDLHAGWNATISFGLANPDLFALLADPARGQRSPAAQEGLRLLSERVLRVARAGRLRMSEDHAVELIHAAGTGAVLTILARPPAERDHHLADTMFDAVLQRILTEGTTTPTDSGSSIAEQAIALRAQAAEAAPLSPAERMLLTEWLTRIIDDGGG